MTSEEPAPAPVESADVGDVVHGATWDGSVPVDLGEGRREYRCHDGSSFVTDLAERISFDVAQSEHLLASLSGAAFVADRIGDAA